MAGKRSVPDMDPDYEDMAEHQAKRQRVIEQDAKQASLDKIEGILQNQFKVAIDDKEEEVKDVDQELQRARSMMDRLRAVIVASYYSRLQQDPSGKMADSYKVPPPSIHPSVKRHIGKAPVGTASPPSDAQDRASFPSTSQSSASTSAARRDDTDPNTGGAMAWSAAAPSSAGASAASGALGGDGGEDAGSSRFTVKKTIIVGNVSRFILPDQREANDQSTHKWMVYVRGPASDQRIDTFVSRVWFFLHPSYRPNDLVEVSTPPFHLTRRGWGQFPVRVQLHFQDPRNKRVDVIHNLKLDETYTGLQTLGAETVVEVELYRDPPAPTAARHHPPLPPPTPSAASDGCEVTAAVTHEGRHLQCQCQPGPAPNSRCLQCGRDHTTPEGPPSQLTDASPSQDSSRTPAASLTTHIKVEPPDDYLTDSPALGAWAGSKDAGLQRPPPLNLIKQEVCDPDVEAGVPVSPNVRGSDDGSGDATKASGQAAVRKGSFAGSNNSDNTSPVCPNVRGSDDGSGDATKASGQAAIRKGSVAGGSNDSHNTSVSQRQQLCRGAAGEGSVSGESGTAATPKVTFQGHVGGKGYAEAQTVSATTTTLASVASAGVGTPQLGTLVHHRHLPEGSRSADVTCVSKAGGVSLLHTPASSRAGSPGVGKRVSLLSAGPSVIMSGAKPLAGFSSSSEAATVLTLGGGGGGGGTAGSPQSLLVGSSLLKQGKKALQETAPATSLLKQGMKALEETASATSLLKGSRAVEVKGDNTSVHGKSTTAATAVSPLLRVTAQGLKPVPGNGTALRTSVLGARSGAAPGGPPKVSLLDGKALPKVLKVDGSSASHFSILRNSSSSDKLQQHPAAACSTPGVVTVDSRGRGAWSSDDPSSGGHTVSLLSGSKSRSLLTSAPKPAVQALLQKRLSASTNLAPSPSPSSLPPVSSNDNSSGPLTALSSSSSPSSSLSLCPSPLGVPDLPAVTLSSLTPGDSPVLGSSPVTPMTLTPGDSQVLGSSPVTPMTLTPGDSYVIANVNNKKVLMKINSATLKRIQEASRGADRTFSLAAAGPNAAGVVASAASTTAPSLGSCLNQGKSGGMAGSHNKALLHKNGNSVHTDVPGSAAQQLPSDFQGQQPLSRAGLELAKVKAALAESQRLGKAALQMSRVRAALHLRDPGWTPPPGGGEGTLPPPHHTSRCSRWFRHGLGSSLVAVVTPGDAGAETGGGGGGVAEDLVSSGSAVVGTVTVVPGPRVEEEETQKRIVVTKKLRVWEVDAAPVSSLSVDAYTDLPSLIRSAVTRHPLIAAASEKSTHPYSAASMDYWSSWHPAKRNASEWSRAKAVRRYLWHLLGAKGLFKGEQLWSTRRIMQWCRLHGLSPNGPGGRPVCAPSASGDLSRAAQPLNKFVTLSGVDGLLAHFPPVDPKPMEEEDHGAANRDIDVEVLGEEPAQAVPSIKRENMVRLDPDLDFLPRSDEAVFIQDTASEIGVKFSPAVLVPGIFSSTAEDMVFAAMLEFASDVVQQACSFALSSHSGGDALTAREVFQAMRSLPNASFFTNQYCGVHAPASPTKR